MAIDEGQRFDRLAPCYDFAIVPTELLIQRRRRELLELAHDRVLEIGIGTGRTLPLYRPELELVGVDLSREMLARGAKRARRLGRRVLFARMSAEHLAFADGSFDTVVLSLVLCSVANLGTALAEIKRVLEPAGRLLLLEHVRPEGRLGPLFDRLDPFWYRRSCHLNRQTGKAIERAGFTIERQDRWLGGILTRIVARRVSGVGC